MSRWLPIDLESIEPFKRENGPDGVTISIYASPADMPQLVRGTYDKAKDRFVIEFRYPSDERTTRREISDHAWAVIGRQSGRLRAIEVDVHALKAKRVTLLARRVASKIKTAIGQLEGGVAPRDRSLNFDAAQQILKKQSDAIYGDLATSQ